MKDKIMIFVIGLLVGAIIATGGCIIYNKSTAKNCDNKTVEKQNNNGNQHPEKGGQRPGSENSQPPEMPSDGQRPEMNGEEPPALPEGENETSEKSTTTDNTDKQSQKQSKTAKSNAKTNNNTEETA